MQVVEVGSIGAAQMASLRDAPAPEGGQIEISGRKYQVTVNDGQWTVQRAKGAKKNFLFRLIAEIRDYLKQGCLNSTRAGQLQTRLNTVQQADIVVKECLQAQQALDQLRLPPQIGRLTAVACTLYIKLKDCTHEWETQRVAGKVNDTQLTRAYQDQLRLVLQQARQFSEMADTVVQSHALNAPEALAARIAGRADSGVLKAYQARYAEHVVDLDRLFAAFDDTSASPLAEPEFRAEMASHSAVAKLLVEAAQNGYWQAAAASVDRRSQIKEKMHGQQQYLEHYQELLRGIQNPTMRADELGKGMQALEDSGQQAGEMEALKHRIDALLQQVVSKANGDASYYSQETQMRLNSLKGYVAEGRDSLVSLDSMRQMLKEAECQVQANNGKPRVMRVTDYPVETTTFELFSQKQRAAAERKKLQELRVNAEAAFAEQALVLEKLLERGKRIEQLKVDSDRQLELAQNLVDAARKVRLQVG